MTLTSEDYGICIIAIEELIGRMEEGIKASERLLQTENVNRFEETITMLLNLKIRLLAERLKLQAV